MTRRFCLYLLCLVATGVLAQGTSGTSMQVNCGTWLNLSAYPNQFYHFDHWSDGDTNAVRSVEIYSDTAFIAYFASNCAEYANLPVVALYDWLMMLDVKYIHDSLGYYFGEHNVTWYRIRDDADDMHNNFPQDDEAVCNGYYLTLARDLQGTGDYYAVVDVSASPAGLLCDGLMRSVIVSYSGRAPSPPRLILTPTAALPGEQLKIVGLKPDETTVIRVYDMAGRLIQSHILHGSDVFYLPAAPVAGCYNVVVQSDSFSETLRYIVHLD
ncbi:MAG: T9SS type A sorting domain-containing protein [Paludibacteraceae bacterium]|nr:T9SS type A sorting domain-containing protein [Paludibacteraceae bacterium]